jgi:uncharacterized protein (TIGR02266 family)
MDEKRQHLRVPVLLQVSYLSRGDLCRDLVTDLSPGGLFIRTSKPLPIGTAVELEVQVGEDPALHVRGKVVWLRKQKSPNEGMGIHFTGVIGPLLLEMVQALKKD